MEKYGEFAHAAYLKMDDKNIEIPGYTLDKELSDDKSKVYTKEDTKEEPKEEPKEEEAILAIRGTASLSDVLPDVALIQGILTSTSRYKKEQDKLVRMMHKYKGFKFVVTGHSLGGSIALELAKKYKNVEAYIFNTGASHWSLAYSLADKLKCKISGKYCRKNIHSFRVLGDPISLLSFGNTTVMPNSLNVHSVGNFHEKLAKDAIKGDILVEDTDVYHKVESNNGAEIITEDNEILEYSQGDKIITLNKSA